MESVGVGAPPHVEPPVPDPASPPPATRTTRPRRVLGAVFAGDPRVWRTAALCSLPLLALIVFYCARPRAYLTGSNSVEVLTYVQPAPPGARVCVPALQIPPGTARIRMQMISRTQLRPALHMTLSVGARTLTASLPPTPVDASRVSAPIFAIPPLPSPSPSPSPAGALGNGYLAATICVTARDLVNWGGTPLPAAPPQPPTVNGQPFPARLALSYLPRAGARRSYLAQASAILDRAALFRPGAIGPWVYAALLLGLLPTLALASVRCLALAVAGGATRRLAAWVFAIAALNFACWALITPPFQAPDEVDHFAYTQSLVERGEAPSRDPGSPLPRWSRAQALLMEDMSFLTDHQVGDTTMPWAPPQERAYLRAVAHAHPAAADGGGNETAATHGPIYYAALAPAYALASSSPLAQLTLMRLLSALIGALAVLFAFLLVRELAPGRPWLAVLAALLVAYEPMYGFISGSVNNDVGVNAGAAALLFLLLRAARRGFTLPWGLATGALAILLPIVKATSFSLYPVAALALLIAVWRHHRGRSAALGWVGLALGALAVQELQVHIAGTFHPLASTSTSAATATGAVSLARAHPLGFLAYLWEVFLPRLPFMAPHFTGVGNPAYTIFLKRGWGAFGWYDVLFPGWVFVAILAAGAVVVALAVAAIARERAFVRRNLPELALLLAAPLAVWAGFEAAFYTTGVRNFLPEFGRYEFPAIIALAALVVAALHGLGRRRALHLGVALAVAAIALSYAGQLLTLTTFYA